MDYYEPNCESITFFFSFIFYSSESHQVNLSKETQVKTHVRLDLVHLQLGTNTSD